MTLPAPTYDLVVLLDPQAEEDVRAKLVADAPTVEDTGVTGVSEVDATIVTP